MNLSTHYYVLALSDDTNRLYEAFRDRLIDIRNTWFPYEPATRPGLRGRTDGDLHAHLKTVDLHFKHYYGQEPLGVVLVGTARIRSAFSLLTDHAAVIIGHSDGEYAATSLEDLGRIAWPIVTGAMATAGQGVARTLEAALVAGNAVVGLDAVVHSVDAEIRGTLLVEKDYRVAPKELATLLDDTDNVVDVVIDKVLALGGNVVFVADGSLDPFQHIALILWDPTNGSRN